MVCWQPVNLPRQLSLTWNNTGMNDYMQWFRLPLTTSEINTNTNFIDVSDPCLSLFRSLYCCLHPLSCWPKTPLYRRSWQDSLLDYAVSVTQHLTANHITHCTNIITTCWLVKSPFVAVVSFYALVSSLLKTLQRHRFWSVLVLLWS